MFVTTISSMAILLDVSNVLFLSELLYRSLALLPPLPTVVFVYWSSKFTVSAFHSNDLTSSNYTPLTASENQTIKTTKSVVNIGAFGLAVNSATSITVGSSGVIKSTIKKHTVSTTITTATTFPPLVYTIPSDNTRVVKPIYVF